MSSSINPQNNRDLNQGICTSSPNLVVLAWTGDELSLGQAQNGVNCDFEVKFDLEVQGQLPPKTIGILTKVFYIYGPNLVILAETGDELSRGQARDWHTDGHTHTDAGNDNARRPILVSGKNGGDMAFMNGQHRYKPPGMPYKTGKISRLREYVHQEWN